MSVFFFVSDLHGHTSRYQKLWRRIAEEHPKAVLMGGDLLPHRAMGWTRPGDPEADFLLSFIVPGFRELRRKLGEGYPAVCVILGNDDARAEEVRFRELAAEGLWHYLNCDSATVDTHAVVGYPFVPPSPFLLKDWERYDVDRSAGPGCLSPEEGRRTVAVSPKEVRERTIREDLKELAPASGIDRSIWLFHAPPRETDLDRAALDGHEVDGVPLSVHVGSVAVRHFIEEQQPPLTLHGHIHEAVRLTGRWQVRLGKTLALTAAHDGPELALVRLDPDHPETATRELL